MEGFDLKSPQIQERLVAQNDLAFSFLTLLPIVPGHLLICPIRLVETFEELGFDEWQAMLELQKCVCQSLKKSLRAEGFNFAWNQGKIAGQTVPHIHLHVVPRNAGDTGIIDYDPRVFLYRPGSRAVSPRDELKEVAQLIRDNLV